MPEYWKVRITSGFRHGNFQIFRTLPLNTDRYWDDPSHFYWYLITNEQHRRQLLSNANRWKTTTRAYFIYHHTLGEEPLAIDPCITDAWFLQRLKACFWGSIGVECPLPEPPIRCCLANTPESGPVF